jgi:hypothetical protein
MNAVDTPRSDSGSTNPPTFLELMDQMGIADPRMRMLAQFMQNQGGPSSPRPEGLLNEDRQAKIRQARAHYERLKDENAVLRERNDCLAAALGACPRCWGEAPDCVTCRGEGTPGAYVPDADAFATYVLPAVRAIQVTRRVKPAEPGGAQANV